jgi:hypothetical protein
LQRETVEEAAVRSIPGHGYSHSIGEQQDISQHSSHAQVSTIKGILQYTFLTNKVILSFKLIILFLKEKKMV